MKLSSAAIASAFLIAPFALSVSPAASADDIWNAAIAVSPTTGSVGTISGPASRSFESTAAVDICARSGATDCKTVVSFTNACATVVKGGDGQFFNELGDDDDTDAREARVLDKCKASDKDCVLVTTYCSGFNRLLGPER